MKKKKQKVQNIGCELGKALTREQIETLLDKFFASIEKQSLPDSAKIQIYEYLVDNRSEKKVGKKIEFGLFRLAQNLS